MKYIYWWSSSRETRSRSRREVARRSRSGDSWTFHETCLPENDGRCLNEFATVVRYVSRYYWRYRNVWCF
jgi:hypothetical protein